MQFFFEKKNQKTSIHERFEGSGAFPNSDKNKSFLVLFFKKELLASLVFAPLDLRHGWRQGPPSFTDARGP